MAPTEASTCPSDETLLAHLLADTAVRTAAGASMTAHLLECNRCVDEISRVRGRLMLAGEIAQPLPGGLIDRAVGRPRPREASETGAWARLVESVRDLLAGLRPTLLVPMAVAAAAILVVARGGTPPGVPNQVELTRKVDLAQSARITRPNADLRERPDRDAASLRSLARGDSVVLFERQDDWYQVALSDGTKGWIEVAAFE